MKSGDRKDSYHRSFVAMRNALRSIIFHNGECYRCDEPNNPLPCECPICLAKAALAGEEGWRFMGYKPERRDSMPREMAMHAAWKHYFMRSAGSANDTSSPMDKLLAQILGHDDRDEITERDWYVATTVVQWLATNVGQCILFDAGYEYASRRSSNDYSERELRLIQERDTALARAETAEASNATLRSRH